MMLTGNNSILNRATQAKEDNIVGSEKEAITLAYNGALANTQGAGVTSGDLDAELKKNGNNADVESTEDGIQVKFNNTNHIYILGENGSVEEYTPLPTSAEGLAAGTPIKNPESYGTNPNAQATADGDGKYFPLPTNAIYDTTTKVDTGVVITYKDSEFVWVPVPNAVYDGTSTLPTTATTASSSLYTPMATTYEYNGKTYYRGMLYSYSTATENEETVTKVKYESSLAPGSTNYREPSLATGENTDTYAPMTSVSGTSYDKTYYSSAGNFTSVTDFGSTMQSEYDKMVESVTKYGGFYIGRYETSYNTATSKVQSVSGVKPASNNDTNTARWYGLYKEQKNFSPESDGNSMVSSMIWGSQYDAMLNWALTGTDKEKVTATDNASHNFQNPNSLLTRTTTENDSLTDKIDRINNIYDLEANLFEWTLEADGTSKRAFRGGRCGTSSSPSYRDSFGSNINSGTAGSRLSLYVK